MRGRVLASAVGALALSAGSFMLTAPAQAASATTSGQCQTNTYAPFSWSGAKIDAEGVTDGTDSVLTLQFSDMPLPPTFPTFINVKGAAIKGAVSGTVDGKPVTFTASGTADVGGGKPVPLPAVSVKVAGADAAVDVVITKHVWTVTASGADFVTTCPPTGTTSISLAGVPVVTGTLPTPTPTPTSTSTPTSTASTTPSESPSPSLGGPDGDSDGKPARGAMTFSCKLEPFKTNFDYAGTVTVAGARDKEGDSEVAVQAAFPKIPGIAPVPIVNGSMTVKVAAKVDGKKVAFEAKSTVNAATKADVPVPVLTSTVETDATKAKVEITGFEFAFAPIDGLAISAACQPKTAVLGDMVIGVGALEEPTGDETDSSDDPISNVGDTTAALPRTGGGDAMPVIALWALALGVVGAGLLVWLPGQRRSVN